MGSFLYCFYVILTCNLLYGSVDAQADNLGTEFLVLFMKNDNTDVDQISLELFITTPKTIPVEVRIRTPTFVVEPFDKTLSVVSGVVEKVVLPASLRIEWIAVENKVVLIESDDDIIVYGLNKEVYSTDGFLIYPTDVIGYEYYTVSHSPTNSFTEFAIASKYDNTHISMRLPNRRNAIPVRVEFNGNSYTAGDWINITLNAYESFMVASYDLADLTSTYVLSDMPVAVFSGNARTWVGESPSRDHLAVQLPPIQAYGRSFPIVPVPGRTVGDVIRIVTADDMTTIRVDNTETKYYEIGTTQHYVDFIIPSDSCTLISSDKPILVVQITQSQQNMSEPGDPTMLVVTASAQYTADYIFSTPSYKPGESYDNWLMVVAKADEVDGLALDGQPFSRYNPIWKEIPTTDLVGTQVRITEGAHTIRHISTVARFSGYVYGTQDRESYSFQIGSRLAPINQPCVITEGTFGDGVDNDCDGLIDEELCTSVNKNKDTDGDGRVDEDCASVRELAEGAPDTGGKQFVVMFMENNVESPQYLPLELYVTPVRASSATVVVESPRWFEPFYSESASVSFGSVKKFNIPYTLKEKGTTMSSKALFVTADVDISVYAVNKERYSADAFLALPIDVLAKDYYIVTHWPNSDSSLCQLGVIGTADGTRVDITFPSQLNGVINVEFNGAMYSNGDTLTVVVDRFTTLQIQSTGDLSGTKIESTQRVAVLSGNIRTSVGSGSSRDHLVAMLPPIDSWGKLYCTVPIPGRTVGDYFYVTSSEDDTVVDVFGVTQFTLQAGQNSLVKLGSDQYRAIQANKPILVTQLSQSQRDINEIGDPTMIVLPSVEQWSNSYTFSTTALANGEVDSSFHNYLVLTAPSNKTQGIILDGQYTPTLFTTWFPIPGTNYSGTSFFIANGVHNILHEDPTVTFSAVVYGNADKESYGFPAGMRLAAINAPCETTYPVDGDGIDNDCDGRIDEEVCEGDRQYTDQDDDGRFTEDCALLSPDPVTTASPPVTTTKGLSGTTTTPWVVIGPPGPAGPQGPAGMPGPQGPPGYNGSPGVDGSDGVPGEDGSPGLTGATGLPGMKGDQGAIGLAGPAGSVGATGMTGVQGATGVTGAKGVKGDAGLSVKGDKGTVGLPGLVGSTGASGQKGDGGVAGVTGATGSPGLTGSQGAQGAPGSKGDMGPAYVDVNECSLGTHGCSHICVNTIGSYYCACPSGYDLDSSDKQCQDTNECSDSNGGCTDVCVNSVGSYQCLCSVIGYRLSNDMRTCVDIDECAADNHNCAVYQMCMNTLGGFVCLNNTVSAVMSVTESMSTCAKENGGCEESCSDTTSGVSCSCIQAGYRLAKDSSSCVDIDECKQSILHTCTADQLCVNSLGSYYCIDRSPAAVVYSDGAETAPSSSNLPDLDTSDLLDGNLVLGLLVWLVILSLLLIVLLILISVQHCHHNDLFNNYNDDYEELCNHIKKIGHNQNAYNSLQESETPPTTTPSLPSMSYA